MQKFNLVLIHTATPEHPVQLEIKYLSKVVGLFQKK